MADMMNVDRKCFCGHVEYDAEIDPKADLVAEAAGGLVVAMCGQSWFATNHYEILAVRPRACMPPVHFG